ncbi:MAG: OadG family protein [Subdoligranulum sp.]|nr:OadG family protein [Subdoligranulum sp.]
MGISKFLTVAAATVSGNPEPSVGVVVATGLILVFGVLVLLYLLITLEGIIFSAIDRKKKGTPAQKSAPAPKKEPAPAPVAKSAAKAPAVQEGIPGEVIAAISAALACMEGGAGYTLRSVKRVKPSGRSAWGQAGINSYTEPF